MSKTKKLISWAPTIIFFTALAGISAWQAGAFGDFTATLKITNLTSTDISEIVVTLYEKPCLIHSLSSKESSVCIFPINTDSHYKISWQVSDADIFSEDIGYVTNGFDSKHELTFLSDGKINIKTNENI